MSKTTLQYNDKSYEYPVTIGTESEPGIDISKLRGQTGLVTLDPGVVPQALRGGAVQGELAAGRVDVVAARLARGGDDAGLHQDVRETAHPFRRRTPERRAGERVEGNQVELAMDGLDQRQQFAGVAAARGRSKDLRRQRRDVGLRRLLHPGDQFLRIAQLQGP